MKNYYKFLFFALILTVTNKQYAQQFTEQTAISISGINEGSAVWGDYDNDGDLDILLTGGPGYNTKIYRNNGNNTFTEQTSILITGLTQSSVAWGDYDNDYDLDFLLSGWNGDTGVSKIYKNNGSNTFTEQTEISLPGVYNSSVAWSDFDKDGDLDCILAGYDQNGESHTKIYWNVNLEFIEAGINLKGGQELAIADYNKDNYPDILIAGTDINGIGHMTLYENTNDGTFTEQSDITLTAIINNSIAWGDYDNDGFLDILLAGFKYPEGSVSKIYKNNGGNSFTEQTEIILSGISEGAAAWGDYDNDGFIDILLSGRDSNFDRVSKIFKNNGNNSFTEQTYILLTGVYRSSIAWGDYDNDNDLDILLTGEAGTFNWISKIYRNNNLISNSNPEDPTNLQNDVTGNKVKLSWDTANDSETPPQSLSYNVQVGTSPGACDIVSPMSDSINGYNRITGMGNTFLNNELIINNLETGTYYWGVQTVDNVFLGSMYSEQQSFEIFPSFTEQTSISLTGVGNSSIAWGDYDSDGDLDILLTGWDTDNRISSIYKNNGGGSFTEQTSISLTGVWNGSVAWGDYDNDGDLDILLTGSDPDDNPVSKIYKNNGNGSFTEQTSISLSNVKNSSVDWGDYDNDGDMDILLTGIDENNTDISKIYKNNGNNSFTEQLNVSLTGVIRGSVGWYDYDNDGDLDIFLSGDTASYKPVSKIYKNNGDNSFSEQTDISLDGILRGSVNWGDYDNDGDLDILLTGMDTSLIPVLNIYRNDADNNFVNINTNIRKVYWSSAAWGDYDNDGYLDVIISGFSGTDITKVYKNNQDGTFSDIMAEISGTLSGSLAWGDYDKDGDLDILLTGSYSSKIYRNNTNFPNQAPTTPENLQSELLGFDMKLSWDKATDPNCSGGSLYYNLRIGTTPGGEEIKAPMANLISGYRNIPAIGNAQCNTFWYIKNLAPGQIYYWSVQAIDQSFTGGPWAPEESFTIPNISADFIADTVCFSKSTSFIDNSQSPEETITSWNWDFGDGNTSVVQNPEHLYGVAGTFLVSLTVGSASYSHTITKNVIVKPAPFAYFNVDTVCQGSTTTVLNLSQTDDEINVAWLWDMGDGTEFTAEQPPKYGYLNPDTYPVKLIITADNGCVDSVEHNAVVVKPPSELITYEGNQCYDETARLIVEESALYSYKWYYNDVLMEGANSHTIHPEQDGIYKIEITPPACNMVSPTYNLNYTDGPAVPEMYLRGPVVWYIACSNTTATTYKWYKNGTEIPNSNKQIIVPNPSDGSYYVELNDGGECWTKSETVVIPDDFYSGKFKSLEELSGLHDQKSATTIYPNPNKGKFTLLFKDEYKGKIYLSVKNLNGKTIRQYYSDKKETLYFEEIDLTKYGTGVYFIEIKYQNKKTVEKIIVD